MRKNLETADLIAKLVLATATVILFFCGRDRGAVCTLPCSAFCGHYCDLFFQTDVCTSETQEALILFSLTRTRYQDLPTAIVYR